MSTKDNRYAVAFHEAGHAVASRYLGRPVVAVTIEPVEDRLGCTMAQLPVPEATPATIGESLVSTADLCRAARALMPPYKSREPGARFVLEALDRGIVLMAGPEAERRATGDCIAEYADFLEARMLAGALAISAASEAHYFRLFQREARSLVMRFCAPIVSVAEALLEKPTLKGDEVDLVAARWQAIVPGNKFSDVKLI